MLTAKDLKGIIPPIVTPLDNDENVDFKELGKVIDYVIEGGVHGLFPLGSNGEFYVHDFEESKKIMDFVVKYVNKRVPILIGTNSITTKGVIRLVKEAKKVGADAVSVLTPMFIVPNEEEIYNHFREIAEASELPIVIYNNPGKTNNDISISLIKKLAAIPNIIGIKNTTLNFSQTIQFIEATKDIENFVVLCGVDYYIHSGMVHGTQGAVAGTANVAPKLVVEIYEKYMAGDIKGSLKAQKKLMPLRDSFGAGTFPTVAKDYLKLMGIITKGAAKPVTPTKNQDRLIEILETLELL